jgi:phosphoglycerate dehydrogenase-like enzyme
VVTPHVGGATHETLFQAGEMIAADIVRFAEGIPPLHLFNGGAVAA